MLIEKENIHLKRCNGFNKLKTLKEEHDKHLLFMIASKFVLHVNAAQNYPIEILVPC